ncbi:MAG: hypothetical protein NZT61_04100 [Deltaproteobacteria bacterium]|nr:hypothetical protein [Deltaproteobacteria bacterium]
MELVQRQDPSCWQVYSVRNNTGPLSLVNQIRTRVPLVLARGRTYTINSRSIYDPPSLVGKFAQKQLHLIIGDTIVQSKSGELRMVMGQTVVAEVLATRKEFVVRDLRSDEVKHEVVTTYDVLSGILYPSELSVNIRTLKVILHEGNKLVAVAGMQNWWETDGMTVCPAIIKVNYSYRTEPPERFVLEQKAFEFNSFIIPVQELSSGHRILQILPQHGEDFAGGDFYDYDNFLWDRDQSIFHWEPESQTLKFMARVASLHGETGFKETITPCEIKLSNEIVAQCKTQDF